MSVSSDELERIVANSDVTQKGISYLINQRGEILAASSQENLDELSGKGYGKLNPHGQAFEIIFHPGPDVYKRQ